MTILLGLTGILFITGAVRVFGRLAFGWTRPAELRVVGGCIELEYRVEMLGRTLRTRRLFCPIDNLRAAIREVRYARIGLYLGLLALSIGTFLGASKVIDGLRVPGFSPQWIAIGFLFVAAGVVLDFMLSSLIDSSVGRCRVVIQPLSGPTWTVRQIDIQQADYLLQQISEAANARIHAFQVSMTPTELVSRSIAPASSGPQPAAEAIAPAPYRAAPELASLVQDRPPSAGPAAASEPDSPKPPPAATPSVSQAPSPTPPPAGSPGVGSPSPEPPVAMPPRGPARRVGSMTKTVQFFGFFGSPLDPRSRETSTAFTPVGSTAQEPSPVETGTPHPPPEQAAAPSQEARMNEPNSDDANDGVSAAVETIFSDAGDAVREGDAGSATASAATVSAVAAATITPVPIQPVGPQPGSAAAKGAWLKRTAAPRHRQSTIPPRPSSSPPLDRPRPVTAPPPRPLGSKAPQSESPPVASPEAALSPEALPAQHAPAPMPSPSARPAASEAIAQRSASLSAPPPQAHEAPGWRVPLPDSLAPTRSLSRPPAAPRVQPRPDPAAGTAEGSEGPAPDAESSED